MVRRSDAPCEPEADEQPARAVLRCGEPSIAYVATQFGTGTGVAIALDGERYVLTNQHVVDPYDAADVQFGADAPERDVPLVGADVAADIALLGPIEARVPTLDISDSAGLERGDEVFLVGFPGESSGDEHEATIAVGHRGAPPGSRGVGPALHPDRRRDRRRTVRRSALRRHSATSSASAGSPMPKSSRSRSRVRT